MKHAGPRLKRISTCSMVGATLMLISLTSLANELDGSGATKKASATPIPLEQIRVFSEAFARIKRKLCNRGQ